MFEWTEKTEKWFKKYWTEPTVTGMWFRIAAIILGLIWGPLWFVVMMVELFFILLGCAYDWLRYGPSTNQAQIERIKARKSPSAIES